MKDNCRVVSYRLIGILVFIGLMVCSPLYADMGAIYLKSQDVTVSEPAQKAVVLHNGSEEILILETDLKSTAKTDILRFIPFPAEPQVSLAPEDALQQIGKLTQAKKLQFITLYKTKGGAAGGKNQPVAEVVSRTKLGAHDVTVVKVHDAAHFSKWVQDYFQDKKQVKTGPKLDQIAEVAADYVKDGIAYFVFDFVTVDNSDKSVAPVAFRFKSKKVYYPLRTSNTIGGEGRVQLFFLAIDCVRLPFNNEILQFIHGPDPSFGQFLFSSIGEVKPEEADAVYPGGARFFDGKPIILQAASYWGPLKFEKDLHSFMLTYYDPNLYQSSGAVFAPSLDPSNFVPQWPYRGVEREDPWRDAELLENRRRHMTGLLVDGSFQLKSAGKKVQFRDGRYGEGAIQAEIKNIAFGDMDGSFPPDAAVITEVSKRGGKACELSLFAGKEIEPYAKPKLEWVGSIPLKSCEVRSFSISGGTARIGIQGGAVDTYKLQGGKLAPGAK